MWIWKPVFSRNSSGGSWICGGLRSARVCSASRHWCHRSISVWVKGESLVKLYCPHHHVHVQWIAANSSLLSEPSFYFLCWGLFVGHIGLNWSWTCADGIDQLITSALVNILNTGQSGQPWGRNSGREPEQSELSQYFFSLMFSGES